MSQPVTIEVTSDSVLTAIKTFSLRYKQSAKTNTDLHRLFLVMHTLTQEHNIDLAYQYLNLPDEVYKDADKVVTFSQELKSVFDAAIDSEDESKFTTTGVQ
jgi:hypothetical protein